jgi:hypothetical protein
VALSGEDFPQTAAQAVCCSGSCQWTPKKVRHFGPPHVHPTATSFSTSFQPPVYAVFLFCVLLIIFSCRSFVSIRFFFPFALCIAYSWFLQSTPSLLYITIFLGPLTRFTHHRLHTHALPISSTAKFIKINASFSKESPHSI